MNPIVQILLIIPLILLGIGFYLLHIKNRLDNYLYRYRQEGIVLQTSLMVFSVGETEDQAGRSLGIVVLTHRRLILLNWKRSPVFDCEFSESTDIRMGKNSKTVTVVLVNEGKKQTVRFSVRNPDAWIHELSRLSRESSAG